MVRQRVLEEHRVRVVLEAQEAVEQQDQDHNFKEELPLAASQAVAVAVVIMVVVVLQVCLHSIMVVVAVLDSLEQMDQLHYLETNKDRLALLEIQLQDLIQFVPFIMNTQDV
jgi:hypothetical protein